MVHVSGKGGNGAKCYDLVGALNEVSMLAIQNMMQTTFSPSIAMAWDMAPETLPKDAGRVVPATVRTRG